MKKLALVVMLVAALMFIGCAKPTPEDVAKDYVKKRFSPDFGMKLDASELEYEILKENEDSATIKISGNIFYEENVELEKVEDQWMIKDFLAGSEKATTADIAH